MNLTTETKSKHVWCSWIDRHLKVADAEQTKTNKLPSFFRVIDWLAETTPSSCASGTPRCSTTARSRWGRTSPSSLAGFFHDLPEQERSHAVTFDLEECKQRKNEKPEQETQGRIGLDTDFRLDLLDEVRGEAPVDLEGDERDAAGDGDDRHESHAVGALHLLLPLPRAFPVSSASERMEEECGGI